MNGLWVLVPVLLMIDSFFQLNKVYDHIDCTFGGYFCFIRLILGCCGVGNGSVSRERQKYCSTPCLFFTLSYHWDIANFVRNFSSLGLVYCRGGFAQYITKLPHGRLHCIHVQSTPLFDIP